MVQAAWQVAKKEVRQLLRDRRSLVLILVMPVLLTMLFGKALGGGELRDIPMVILNEDESPDSNVIVTMLGTHAAVRIVDMVTSLRQAQDLLARGKVKAALVIPSGVMRQIQAGEQVDIQLVLDGTDATSAPIVQGVVQQVIAEYSADLAVQGLIARHIRPSAALIRPLKVTAEVRNNPGLQYLSFVMPGVIGLTLQLLTVMLMAINIPRERERGTLDQLMATPIPRPALILGKLLPLFFTSLFNVGTILVVADRGFGIPALDRLPLLLGSFGETENIVR